MKLTSISQDLFDKRVIVGINSQPIRRTVSVGDIKIVDTNVIEWNGTPIKMTESAFNQLCKIIGVPVQFNKTVNSLFNEEQHIKFLNNVRNALSRSDNSKSVTLIVNKIQKKIVGVLKEDRQLISNKGFLDTVSQTVDKGNLIVNDFAVNDNTGEIIINTTNPNGYFDVKGVKDEAHIGGVTFANSMKSGFEVTPYTNRLVCTNGMIVKGFSDDDIHMNNLSNDSMNIFWKKLGNLIKNNFKPGLFDERVIKAMNTPASLSELTAGSQALMKNLDATFEVKDVQSWIPLQQTLNKYHAAGIDTNNFNQFQMKNAKTGTSVWDLLQSITHWASHDNGFNLSEMDRIHLQMFAGNMFAKKTYDFENIVKSPY